MKTLYVLYMPDPMLGFLYSTVTLRNGGMAHSSTYCTRRIERLRQKGAFLVRVKPKYRRAYAQAQYNKGFAAGLAAGLHEDMGR